MGAGTVRMTMKISRRFSAVGLASLLGLAAAMAEPVPTLVPMPPIPNSGPEVPFPLKEQIPVPWEKIEGTWEVPNSHPRTAYGFDLQKKQECDGQPILRILSVDEDTGRVLARGFGLSREAGMLIRGVMKDDDGDGPGASSIVIVRAFTESGSLKVLLTVRSLTDRNGKAWHYVLRRVADLPLAAPDLTAPCDGI